LSEDESESSDEELEPTRTHREAKENKVEYIEKIVLKDTYSEPVKKGRKPAKKPNKKSKK
jgi:hypothetical protein